MYLNKEESERGCKSSQGSLTAHARGEQAQKANHKDKYMGHILHVKPWMMLD